MKTIKIMMSTLIASLSFTTQVMSTNFSAVVLNLYTRDVGITPEMAGDLLRIELDKTGFFKVYDKHDMNEALKLKGLTPTECFGKECLYTVGKEIGVNKIFSGSIESLGKKIVVSLKVLDIATNTYEFTRVEEFINVQGELQVMIQLTLHKMLSIQVNQDAYNTLVYYQQPPETPKTNIKNNGPRVGASVVFGDLAERLMAPESEGGWDAFPVLSQFGYQFEKAYLSAGNFNALLEGLIMISGPEQGIFNPKFVLMNGFRSSKSGLEFAFGPSFGVEKTAKSYFDTEQNKWFLASEWNEGIVPGVLTPNPYPISNRIDRRGVTKANVGWVIGIGKTFKSGYLNIPVNIFTSFSKHGMQTGVSVGFNIGK
jgi:hypothetical protein